MPLVHVFCSCLSVIGSRVWCYWFTLTGMSWFCLIFLCSHCLCDFIHWFW